MRSRIHYLLLFIIAFIGLIDGMVYAGLRLDFQWTRSLLFSLVYWMVPAAFIGRLLLYLATFRADSRAGLTAGLFVFNSFFLAVYLPKLAYAAFVLLEYNLKLTAFCVSLLFNRPWEFGEFMTGGPLNFISLLVLPVAILAFVIILGGMLFGRFNYRIRPIEILFPDLPPEFDGFRIVHISDLHLGSLNGHQDKINRAVDMINREAPDLILFTGDMVNNLADEADGWTDLLSRLKSVSGNFSILGNHDYGEFYDWPDKESRKRNMEQLYRTHEDAGFILLLNRSERIRKGSGEIYIAGVENCGRPPFKQYGDLGKALKEIPQGAFTLLLSHDPSHWDAEVLPETGVQLTLSGHTHGCQFGIRTRRINWSPIQIMYPRWIGLYRQGQQYLHINPGLGYIGYAGRIWIPPEITVITLKYSA